MPGDALGNLLRLVAEGRLTADEAAPILAALEARGSAGDQAKGGPAQSADPADRAAAGNPGPARTTGPASALRIEVREGNRSVVNLRLPIAAGRFALDRVPGLSGDQVDRVREALHSGQLGPVLTVDDNGNGVRIVLE